jgi:hypothetical protein
MKLNVGSEHSTLHESDQDISEFSFPSTKEGTSDLPLNSSDRSSEGILFTLKFFLVQALTSYQS